MKKLSDDVLTVALNAAPKMMIIFAIILLVPGSFGYPNGAPPGICTLDKKHPNHNGLSPQTTTVPFDIFMSKDRVTSLDDNIIVTIRSTPSGPDFRGFLVLAKDKTGAAVGTWEDDSQSHPLAGCSATTHDNKNKKRDIQLKWKPQGQVPDGPISMTAAIVQQFDLFWVDIPLSVKASDQSPVFFQAPPKVTDSSTAATTTAKDSPTLPKGGIPLPGLNKPPAVDQSKDSNNQPPLQLSTTLQPKAIVNPTVATTKATTTKRRSFIDRLLNRGGNKEKVTSTTTTTTTTTTTIKPTTTTTTTIKPTTTKNPELQNKQGTVTTEPPSTTTKAPGFFKRIFGRKDSSS